MVAFAAMAAGAEAPPVTVGVVLPQSGDLAALATGMRQALLLWQDEANARGGMLGRKVVLRLLDDRSEAIQDGQLYRQLIGEYRAELLIGPFGSAATLMAAAAAEAEHRVLVNATGTLAALGRDAYRYVFQVPAPAATYGAGPLAIAKQAGYRRLFIVARDDPTSRDAAEGARADAAALGLEPGEVTVLAGGTTDYAEQIRMAQAAHAQAWVAFGLPQDAADLVIAFKRAGYAPQMLAIQGAADPRFLRLVGQDAEYAIGILPYAPSLPSEGNAEFVRAYEKKWASKPDVAAAEGYAAASVLEAAVRRAGTLDQEKLRDALSALEIGTVLGGYKVDRYGGQIEAKPAAVQILKGRRIVVWPERWAQAPWQLPLPPWGQRKLIQPKR